MKLKHALPVAASFMALAVSAQNSQTYLGTGSGFGNEVGGGNLVISDSPAGMDITFTPGSGGLYNDCVLYLDTQAGGFADTSQFMDNGDGGREAISGYNSSNPSQTVAYFPSGFGADYAISIENTYMGVFSLAAGGNNSLNFLFGASENGNGAGPFSLAITPAQMSQIGLTEGSGQTFGFVGSLISESAYRANETFGPSVTVPDNSGDAPNAGFNGTQTFTSALTYTLVPEPGTVSLIGMGLAGLVSLRRRK